MVGDRLDTDIEGANNLDMDSLLVLTGVTGLRELTAAGPELRPTYVAVDLEGLFMPHPSPEQDGKAWHCGGWTATVPEGRLEVTGQGSPDDWWRTVACASWDHLDRSGSVADVSDVAVPDADGSAPAG